MRERGEYWLIVYYGDVADQNVTAPACDLVLYNNPPNIYLRELVASSISNLIQSNLENLFRLLKRKLNCVDLVISWTFAIFSFAVVVPDFARINSHLDCFKMRLEASTVYLSLCARRPCVRMTYISRLNMIGTSTIFLVSGLAFIFYGWFRVADAVVLTGVSPSLSHMI